MTLSQVIHTFERVARSQPSIKMIVQHDVFRLNSAPSQKYGVFAWLQNQHSVTMGGMQSFNFTFFYVDRLVADKSNTTEVQSVGVETLGNILRTLDAMDIAVESYTLQPFTQRFTDECAGVFCNVQLSVLPGTLCDEAFADFNEDFNDDFLIY